STGHINTASRQKVMICEPAAVEQELDCARQIFANLAKKAYRRPITDADLEAPLAFFHTGREQGGFDNGIKNGMMAILTSPKFLFRAESPEPGATPDSVVPVGELELASRLAFFLWGTVPDEELVELAAAGELRKGNTLDAQIDRML